jgi:hypothetical protein
MYGDIVGFLVRVLMFIGFETTETLFPPDRFGDIVIASPVQTVAIDVKPETAHNSINPKSRGKIPVAILSTGMFDASIDIDVSTLTFGRTGDEQSLAFCHETDVNADGLVDLNCHFETTGAGFRGGDATAVLKGLMRSGRSFEGVDAVRLVP